MNDQPTNVAPIVRHEIVPRTRDLGGFEVRRVLPAAEQRMVGPFVFFDQMGPVEFLAGRGIDVRPHPHIGLATVTYLFAGSIVHRDSLGSVQSIASGDVNWMTAGRGIVHSERSDAELRRRPQRLSGIQIWVALPERDEETAPDFTHYPAATLGRSAFRVGDATPRGHPVHFAGADRDVHPERVTMHDLAVEQIGQRGEPDMRMRPHVEAGAGGEYGGTEMIEEHERTDGAAGRMRQRAPNAESAEVDAARHDHVLDGITAHRVAGNRILARKEAHVILKSTAS